MATMATTRFQPKNIYDVARVAVTEFHQQVLYRMIEDGQQLGRWAMVKARAGARLRARTTT